MFILSPVILFGQARRQAIVDSVKAAGTDLHGAWGSIGNTPGTRIKSVQVTDSGEYVTMVIRVHVDEPIVIKSLPVLAAATMKTGTTAAERMRAVNVPTLPIIRIADSIKGLALVMPFELRTTGTSTARIAGVALPPLPHVQLEIETLPLAAVTQLRIASLITSRLNMAMVPPVPNIAEEIDALALLTVAPLKIRVAEHGILEMAEVPAIPHMPEEIDALSFAAVTELKIESLPYKMNMALVLDMPEIDANPLEDLPLYEVMVMDIDRAPAATLEMRPVPPLEEEKTEVEEMHLSDEGYSLLEKLEGFSPDLYSLKDGGFTIGFGFFVPYGEGNKWSKGVTWAEAERLIRLKVPSYEAQVKQYVNIPLTQREFDALTMLAYNLGGFSKATSIVNDINNRADYETLQRDWMRFVHSKAPGVMAGLMNRRKDEMKVSNESNYQPERKIQVLKSRR